MTTSYTTSDDFGTEIGEDFDEGSGYPSAFGITFTPKVSGIAAGIGGLLIAIYLFSTQVLPVSGELGELKEKKEENEQQIETLEALKVESRLQQKKAELQQVQQTKQEVINLFANPENLETLLISLNEFGQQTNVELKNYSPQEEQIVNDPSFSELAVGRIKSKAYQMEIAGSFSQIQLFLQDLERLQPLLVVRDFNAQVLEPQNFRLANSTVVVDSQPVLQANMTVNAVSIAPPLPKAEPEEEEQPQ